MIDLLCCFRTKDHPIWLNKEFHLDLKWWAHVLDQWHGASFWLFHCLSLAVDIEVASYAAASFGVATYFRGFWFTGRWVASLLSQSIAYQELFPVVVAAHVLGTQWSRKHVLFRSDNEAVVHMLNSKTSRTPSLITLLRSLLLSAARYSFSFSSQNIPGVNNLIADSLSRFHWQGLQQLAPEEQHVPT